MKTNKRGGYKNFQANKFDNLDERKFLKKIIYQNYQKKKEKSA